MMHRYGIQVATNTCFVKHLLELGVGSSAGLTVAYNQQSTFALHPQSKFNHLTIFTHTILAILMCLFQVQKL